MSKHSAGVVLIKDNKILLVHPTRSKWEGTYSIPKGHIEKDEDYLTTALRETKEEIGLSLKRERFNENDFHTVVYRNKHNKMYKKVFYYILKLENNEIEDVIDKNNLQLEEVDWAGFLTKEEAKDKLFWRFEEILNYIK